MNEFERLYLYKRAKIDLERVLDDVDVLLKHTPHGAVRNVLLEAHTEASMAKERVERLAKELPKQD